MENLEDREFMLIRCENCSLGACKIECAEDALVLVAGDLLLVTEKCSVCGQYKGYKIPDCIANCPASAVKVVVDKTSTDAKREGAVSASGYF